MAWIGTAEQDERKSVTPIAHAGHDEGYLAQAEICWADTERGRGPTGKAIRMGTIQIARDVEEETRMLPWREEASRRGYRSSIALPLKHRSGIFGALTIYAAQPDAFDADEQGLLGEIAANLGYGHTALHDRTDREVALQRFQRSMEATVEVLANVVEARDPYTSGHQRRVAMLATSIAREMNASEDMIHGIHLAAIIHDIGKIHIPAEILSKPGKLTPLERQMIETHAEDGYNIVKGVDFPWPIAEAVRQHHERLDGTGYPRGLTGSSTSFEAKILAVSDVVEAMMSHRPYRAALGLDVALAEIKKGSGRLYDADMVRVCCELLRGGRFKFE